MKNDQLLCMRTWRNKTKMAGLKDASPESRQRGRTLASSDQGTSDHPPTQLFFHKKRTPQERERSSIIVIWEVEKLRNQASSPLCPMIHLKVNQ